MSVKKQLNEEDARIVYADIIDMPHWTSPTRKHMSLYDRAAQFSPFAALTGYDDMVIEEARNVDNKIELDASQIEIINRKLEEISDAIDQGRHPVLSITYFVKDPLKAGGSYQNIEEAVRKVDIHEQKLVLERITGPAGTCMMIDFADILDIS